MKKRKKALPLKAATAFSVALLLSLLLMQTAFATVSGSLADGNIGLSCSDSNATWTASETTVTSSSISRNWAATSSSSSTLTITNNSGQKRTLSFDYAYALKSGWASEKSYAYINDAAVGTASGSSSAASSSGSYTVEMESGGTITVKITAGAHSGSAQMTLTNIKLVADGAVTHTFQTCGVAYTVTYKQSADAAATSVAVPASGDAVTLKGVDGSFTITPNDTRYHLVNATANGTKIAVSSSGLIVADDDASITPNFVYDANGKAPFSVSSVSYWDWDTAMDAAGTSGTVILTDNYTLPSGSYSVPGGVTLLLPYAEGKTTIQSSSASLPYANYAQVNDSYADLDPQTDLYLTLTIPSGATVTNNGTIVIGGTIEGASKQRYAGVCSGSHCNLELDGDLYLTNGSILSVVGYIIGDGMVHATSTGATIYQLYSVMDFNGGSYCLAATGKYSSLINYAVDHFDGEELIIAYNRFAMISIQTTIELNYGNYMYGYCDLYASSQHNLTTGLMVGSTTEVSGWFSSDIEPLLELSSGASITISYDPNEHVDSYYSGATEVAFDRIGRTKLTLTGGASLGSVSLTVDVTVVKIDMDSAEMTVNIPYNFDIELLNGTYTVNNDMSLLPGADLTVGNGATLNVGARFNVYPGLVDARYVSSGASVKTTHANASVLYYPTTQMLQSTSFGGNGSANLVVDGGALNFNSGAKFAGLVQTTGTGTLTVNSGATVSGNKYQFGATGHTSALTYNAYVAGACLFTENGEVIDPATGAATALAAGVTYTATPYSAAIGSYSYTMYTDSSSTSTTISYTEPLGATVQGAWYSTTLDTGTTDSASAVARVTTSGGEATYYSTLSAAVAAARDGATVTLLKDVTLPEPVSSSYAITIDLGGNTVKCSNGLLAHGGSKRVTLKLGSGTVTDSNASNIPMIVNYGTLTIDTGTASAIWGTSVTSDIGTEVIYNTGTLAVTGSGTISFSDKCSGMIGTSMSGLGNDGALTRFASVIRNKGALTVEGVKLNIDNEFFILNSSGSLTTTTFSAAILNHMATVESLRNVTITNTDSYCVYNLGGRIKEIIGGSYSGYYGIENRNVRYNSLVKDASDTKYALYDYFVCTPAVIDKIDGLATDVTIYALYNRGTVGTICGNCDLKATRYTVYNAATWYYTSDAVRYENKTDSTYGRMRQYDYVSRDFSKMSGNRTAVLDSSGEPTLEMCSIGSIEGNAKISTTGTTGDNNSSYALVNVGYIGKIGGSAEISSNYRYALQVTGGGFLGTLTDAAYIHATNGYSIEVGGSATYHYEELRDADDTTQYQVKYWYTPSRLDSIDGNGVKIEAGSSYAMNVAAEVGSIGGTVDISAAAAAISVSGTNNATRIYTRSWNGTTETARQDNYTYNNGHIASIGASADDKVTITVTGNTGISVYAQVDLIGPGTTVSAKGYAITVGNSRAAAQNVTITSETDSNDSSYYLTKYERNYIHTEVPTVTTINGAKLYTTTSSYALLNYGHIGTVKNAEISSSGSSYAILNHLEGAYIGERNTVNWYRSASQWGTSYAQFGGSTPTTGTVTRQQSQIDTIQNCTLSAKSYVLKNGGKIGLIQDCTIMATTGDRAISNSDATMTQSTYSYTTPVYDASSESNNKFYTTTTSAVHTYGAQPVIEKIGSGNTLSATKEVLINFGVINTIGDADGEPITIKATNGVALHSLNGVEYKEGSTVTQYVSASVGTIQNVQAVGTNYGIRNGNGNANYTPTIGNIGEGVVTVATNSDGYGLHNDKNAVITEVSAGDYRGGNGARVYAVGNAGTLGYTTGKELSTVTRTATANGTDYVCYFVTAPLVAAIITGDEADGYYTTLADAATAYAGSGYIKLLANTTGDVSATGKTLVLDLAGYTVDGSVTAAKLYGFDTSGSYTVNDTTHAALYTTPAGKITGAITGLQKLYLTPETSGAFQRYVAITNADGETSFHRFNISVTGFRVLFGKQENGDYAATIFYRAAARGDEAVQKAVTSSGFLFVNAGNNAGNVETVYSNGEKAKMNEEIESTIGWGGIVEKSNATKEYGAQAYLGFGKDVQMSEMRSYSLIELLAIAYENDGLSLYNEGTEDRDPQEILDEAMTKLNLETEWNAAKEKYSSVA